MKYILLEVLLWSLVFIAPFLAVVGGNQLFKLFYGQCYALSC